MNIITEGQYKQLCTACDALIKENSFSFERIANSSLHVIREHPIFLKNYSAVFHKEGVTFSVYLIKKFIFHLVVGSYRLIDSIIRNYIFGDRLIEDKRAFEDIFISHFLNDSFIDHKRIFTFLNYLKKLKKKSFKPSDIY